MPKKHLTVELDTVNWSKTDRFWGIVWRWRRWLGRDSRSCRGSAFHEDEQNSRGPSVEVDLRGTQSSLFHHQMVATHAIKRQETIKQS